MTLIVQTFLFFKSLKEGIIVIGCLTIFLSGVQLYYCFFRVKNSEFDRLFLNKPFKDYESYKHVTNAYSWLAFSLVPILGTFSSMLVGFSLLFSSAFLLMCSFPERMPNGVLPYLFTMMFYIFCLISEIILLANENQVLVHPAVYGLAFLLTCILGYFCLVLNSFRIIQIDKNNKSILGISDCNVELSQRLQTAEDGELSRLSIITITQKISEKDKDEKLNEFDDSVRRKRDPKFVIPTIKSLAGQSGGVDAGKIKTYHEGSMPQSGETDQQHYMRRKNSTGSSSIATGHFSVASLEGLPPNLKENIYMPPEKSKSTDDEMDPQPTKKRSRRRSILKYVPDAPSKDASLSEDEAKKAMMKRRVSFSDERMRQEMAKEQQELERAQQAGQV